MSSYFTLSELTRSDVAVARGIDNTPTPQAQERLQVLIEKLLDPLRKLWGAPITVNSGYRSPLLNKAVRGASNSQHLRGEAADISAGSPAANRKLFDLLRSSNLSFDQLIDERNYTWIHVSWCGSNRRQVLHL